MRTLGNVWGTVRRICILMLGRKRLLFFPQMVIGYKSIYCGLTFSLWLIWSTLNWFTDLLDAWTQDYIVQCGRRFQLCVKDKFILKWVTFRNFCFPYHTCQLARLNYFIFFIVYSFLIKIMFQGNIEQFIKFTGWYGPNVLYFGDHVYSDLRVSWIVCNCFQFYINILT